MGTNNVIREKLTQYALLTAASLLIIFGNYFFKYPNNFVFGGVTGVSILLSRMFTLSTATYNLIINIALLLIGILVLGKEFVKKTLYVCVTSTLGLSLMEKIYPMDAPLTDQPMLELVFAIVIPGVASAILFNMEASSGGTDIPAMIIQKYTTLNVTAGLFIVDLVITLLSFVVFDIETGLFSITGLLCKTLVIDGAIENINLCKYFTIVCTEPDPICDFIHEKLHRTATIFGAEGTYSHRQKYVILAVMRRSQAVRLRRFIKDVEPSAFLMITNSSEIIGKGFRGYN
jgi:uncharacterized membrane-anchored protein YitT (DUF2179 family)